MPVRARILIFFLPFAAFLVPGSPALATSRLRSEPGRHGKLLAAHAICPVSARFVEALPKRGKVVWVFERLPGTTTACPLAEGRFEVWIWQGRYSNLNRKIVYPLDLEEPAAGDEVDLELSRRDLRELPAGERYSGWFLAEGDRAVRVRTR